MKITWLGHGSFRLEIADQVLLIDPWFTGNPVFPTDRRAEAIKSATHILITHGHGDHAGDALALTRETGAPLVGIYDLMGHWAATEDVSTVGFNKGGTVMLGDVAVSMVAAVHSSSIGTDAGPAYAGAEAGFVIKGEGRVIYVSGDTDIMADMGWIGEYYAPDIGILCAGGHFTMDMKAAAWAAKKFFNFRTVIPCHYKTFPILEQSADVLRDGLPGVDVRTPEVMDAVEL
ncbi:metal-dependent hydrolase [Rhodobacteraceae bacterium]|nr:metal-dependent hydrolase [Paracoccaceae bacterium]